MRFFLMITALFLTFLQSNAQEIRFDLGYNYLSAPEWDNAIQTYNFSRPFLENNQPLLMHGLSTSGSYLFRSSSRMSHGVGLSYSYFRSAAKNENLAVSLNLSLIKMSYILHLKTSKKEPKYYFDLVVSSVAAGLFRSVEPYSSDDSEARAFGIGGEVAVKAGYMILSNGQMTLSPFISLGYVPYFFSPDAEASLNQTKGLTSKRWTNMLTGEIGLAMSISKARAR
ncbi:MAG: hypothetical protein ACI93L_001285 [Cyclobacteriaceae bacterium]|jgi:hypothetical protein